MFSPLFLFIFSIRPVPNTIQTKKEAENRKFTEIAHFEPSQRGSTVLYYNGKRFTRDGMFQDSINWRCCYFRDKCRARAITKEINGITKVRLTNGRHTCTPKRVPRLLKKEIIPWTIAYHNWKHHVQSDFPAFFRNFFYSFFSSIIRTQRSI